MTYKEYKHNSYRLYTVKTNKFKTCHMEIIFYNKFNKDNITKENVLADVLAHSSKKFPKKKFVVEKLEDLYNASFYAVTSKIGDIRTINFNYSFISPEFADKNYLKEVIAFPFEMIFNPNILNDEFDTRTLKIIKNYALADIQSIKENVSRYAIKRALINTSKDMSASYNLVGNIKDLNKINESNLVSFYHELLNNYYCDIYVIGNLDMEKVDLLVSKSFENNIIQTYELNPYSFNNLGKKVKDIKEYDIFGQASLVCVYDVDKLTERERNSVMAVFNRIFGSGSLTNKLYQNLREKNSLCYSVRSMYQRFDNLMLIYTGIDIKNRSKAIKYIKKSLDEMKNGDFSEDDIENAVKLATNNLKSMLDNPSVIVDNYFVHNIAGVELINERMDTYQNVTKKEIIELAKKIRLVTIYSLAKGDNK